MKFFGREFKRTCARFIYVNDLSVDLSQKETGRLRVTVAEERLSVRSEMQKIVELRVRTCSIGVFYR